MAISRIRGEQIRLGTLKNEHINDSAAIAESKLSINWDGHYHSALQVKKVVDFIQVNGSSVSGTSFSIPSLIIPNSVPNVESEQTDEGVIVSGEKNKAPIRSAVTGDPIVDEDENQVYGRVEFEAGEYVLKFYSVVSGVETAFSMPSGTVINWQYAKRFNLDNVPEMFAANEKFVEGAADATAHLNISQIAKDLYGEGSYSLDRDGNANLGTSIAQQISNEINARTNADQAIRNDLSDTTSAVKGANSIGVYDSGDRFTAGNVNEVLVELHDEIAANKSEIEASLASEVSDLEDAISAEEAARISADNTLTANLNQEISDRQAAVSAEEAARIAADNTLQSNITAEQNARIAAVSDEATARANADSALQSSLNQEVSDRQAGDTANANALQAYKDDLNNAATNKGASLVKVDGGSGLNGTTVQSVLVDLETRLASQEEGGGAEVTATHTRESSTTNGVFASGSFTDLEDRIVDIETTVDSEVKALEDAVDAEESRALAAEGVLQGNIDNEASTRLSNDQALQSNIDAEATARLAADNALDAAIDAEEAARIAADNALDARVDTLEASKHDHFKAVYQVISSTDALLISDFGAGLPNYTVGNESLDVYVNGILQNEGLHYAEVVGGASINFDPANDGTELLAGDVVTIKYYNA
jgi:hypothetical protein